METPAPASTSDYMLGQIDAKVTHLLEAHRIQREDIIAANTIIHSRLDGHDERITKVERGHWKIAGIASVLPIVLTVVGFAAAYLKGP